MNPGLGSGHCAHILHSQVVVVYNVVYGGALYGRGYGWMEPWTRARRQTVIVSLR